MYYFHRQFDINYAVSVIYHRRRQASGAQHWKGCSILGGKEQAVQCTERVGARGSSCGEQAEGNRVLALGGRLDWQCTEIVGAGGLRHELPSGKAWNILSACLMTLNCTAACDLHAFLTLLLTDSMYSHC